jgi:hypothetical protein
MLFSTPKSLLDTKVTDQAELPGQIRHGDEKRRVQYAPDPA